ncbi:mitochondrial peripheral inner membrane protein [Sporothrix bragantina]|uniref:Mitochondrial peripheral inner membrane protein n=1 Tax=Sporothrix bragantina TaxID=671064 RepID=A0ABP0BAK2_9PEZI
MDSPAGLAGLRACGGTNSSNSNDREALNDRKFLPYDVVAREDISPTAFVLTVRLSSGTKATQKLTRSRMNDAWAHGLWSVEVKQPQLQIARDYTPLPEVYATHTESAGESDDDTTLRLFVRVVPGGEVTKYLSRKTVGSTIELRGPHPSFDVVARLGDKSDKSRALVENEPKKMIILAGGTGVATALQAVDAALRASPTVSISLLWANRQANDCYGLNAGPLPAELNPVVRDIRALQALYGSHRLQVQTFVDAERTFITEAHVRKAIGGSDRKNSWFTSWRKGEPEAGKTPEASGADGSCIYHSQKKLTQMHADPLRNRHDGKAACSCAEGKNLVLVSGPDGFIEAWAGPKAWQAGKERQGPVGGILGQILNQDPQTLSKWQVLKL